VDVSDKGVRTKGDIKKKSEGAGEILYDVEGGRGIKKKSVRTVKGTV
jgi:hypothetical protein